MKSLLTTTAAALVLATTAHAESHTMGLGDIAVSADDFLASDLIGMRIYSSDREIQRDGGVFSAEDQWDDIGEVNDIVVSPDGEVLAGIVGVGGFLGIGEKNVAVSMDEIAVYTDEGGSRFLVMNTTAETLEGAPDFDMPVAEMTGADIVETDIAEQPAADMTDEEMAADMSGDGDVMADDMQMAETDMVEDTDIAAGDLAIQDPTLAEAGDPMVAVGPLDGYSAADIATLSSEELTGATVYGIDDENIGEVSQLIVDESGALTGAIIDVGGFLGLGEKPVELGFDDLNIMVQDDGDDIRVQVNMTEEQLDALPEYAG